MNPQLVLRSALGDLVGGRFYPSTFPQDTVWPAILSVIVSTTPHNMLCDSDDDTDDTEVELRICAREYDAMRALSRSVNSRLNDVNPPCVRLPYSESYDAATKTHRGILKLKLLPSTTSDSP